MNKLIGTGLIALLVLTALSCGKLDVVASDSARAFDEALKTIPRAITADEKNGGWSLEAPDESARFIWSKNFAKSPGYDAALEFDAAPFIAAGLTPEKLPGQFIVNGGKIMVGTKLGQEEFKYSGEVTPLASYQQIVKLKRSAIGYHMAMDHYGVNLGNGNMFEWAKDLKANDKDLVFVLEPAPFIAAGVNPEKIEGWAFAKVTVDDENGKPIQVDKILKPFNL